MMENIQDYAFLISDGLVTHLTTKYGYESYNQALTSLKRELAFNWSVVEDSKIISSYVRNNEKHIPEMEKFEVYQTNLEAFKLLIKQQRTEARG